MSVVLSEEQNIFIDQVLKGNNVLVDACVGSGKTTAIQALCEKYPKYKRILYLTYNKLLKIDAKEKIKCSNATVTNYHGYAWYCLNRIGINVSPNDTLQVFNKTKPPVGRFDLIVLDEYQDIDQEISEVLDYLKAQNPNAVLVAVGDMKQKIYDKTSIDVSEYIDKFLSKHIELEFTNCYRLPSKYSEKLGRIWKKNINGVNESCEIIEMTKEDVIPFLANYEPRQILCLGARNGVLSTTLNVLETKYNEKFNKKTVYASISDTDSSGNVKPSKNSAIFTTFDSSKGLERDICVVFDFTESYWRIRVRKPLQKYEILKNIFLVAASRGKKKIVFVKDDEELLSEETISTSEDMNESIENVIISEMFDFKYQEDIEECFSLLDKKEIIQEDMSLIEIRNKDGLIDLSPCIGIYQEAFYFDNYDINREFELFNQIHTDRKVDSNKYKRLEKKILYLTSLETNQMRYIKQVSLPLVKKDEQKILSHRLGTVLRRDEEEQVICSIPFAVKRNGDTCFEALGYADVLKDGVIYELKFVSELTHIHFLQCACYMIAQNIKKGILWNTRNNEMYEITIPDKNKFLDAVTKTITKRKLKKYYKPRRKT